jgi:hypothetical protein
MMRFTVHYFAGSYNGERTVFAEDEEHAIGKVKAWVHKQTSMPIYAEGYEIVEQEDGYESNARTVKPSPEQIETLRAMAEHSTGRIERVPGGWWAIPGYSMVDRLGVGSSPSGWSTAVQTIRALERRGWVQRAHRYTEEWKDDRELTVEGRAVAGAQKPNGRRYTLNASDLEHARNIRRTFTAAEPKGGQEQVGWEWPREMQHIGQCEAVMYSSDKWKPEGQFEDYKHVAEGKQELLVTPGFVREYNQPSVKLGVVGPIVELDDPMPSHFAVLAKVLGVQAQFFVGDDESPRLGGEAAMYQIDIAGATLGAARHPATGQKFLVIYTASGLHCIITGSVLDIEKDGIVG